MKKNVSLLIIFALMLGILCCFTSCEKEDLHNTGIEDQAQENNDTVTEISDTDHSDADYSDHVSTESTPTCCVTKVWFEDF